MTLNICSQREEVAQIADVQRAIPSAGREWELDITKKVLSLLLSSYKSSEATGTVEDLSRVRSGKFTSMIEFSLCSLLT